MDFSVFVDLTDSVLESIRVPLKLFFISCTFNRNNEKKKDFHYEATGRPRQLVRRSSELLDQREQSVSGDRLGV